MIRNNTLRHNAPNLVLYSETDEEKKKRLEAECKCVVQLSDCIRSFFSREAIDSFQCPSCNAKTVAHKYVFAYHLLCFWVRVCPPALIRTTCVTSLSYVFMIETMLAIFAYGTCKHMYFLVYIHIDMYGITMLAMYNRSNAVIGFPDFLLIHTRRFVFDQWVPRKLGMFLLRCRALQGCTSPISVSLFL